MRLQPHCEPFTLGPSQPGLGLQMGRAVMWKALEWNSKVHPAGPESPWMHRIILFCLIIIGALYFL